MVNEETGFDYWSNVKAPVELEEMIGVIVRILEPQEVKTEHGMRKQVQFIIEGKEGRVVATEFLPGAFPIISARSNIGKIMLKYGAKTMGELIGKEVELLRGKQDFLKISKE